MAVSGFEVACYKPLTGYRARKVLPSGRRPVVFSRQEGFPDLPVQLPCGQCIGCRLDRSQQWATRCMHEASMWDVNCALTLSYDDKSLPLNGSLVPHDVTLFLRRLRRWHKPALLSYFYCGEYGGQFDRPHYHVLLFGVWFGDAVPFKKSQSGFQLYRSERAVSLWSHGYADISELSFETAAYAARYVVDKLTGEKGAAEYRGRVPPFVRMSLRPAIGLRWFERFHDDVFPSDEVIVSGRRVRTPLYYDRRASIRVDDFGNQFTVTSSVLEEAKEKRAVEGVKSLRNRSVKRLAVREEVARARLALYKK